MKYSETLVFYGTYFVEVIVFFFLFLSVWKKVAVNMFCFVYGQTGNVNIFVFFAFCFLFLSILLLSLPFSLDLYTMRDSLKFSDDLKLKKEKEEDSLVNRKLLQK